MRFVHGLAAGVVVAVVLARSAKAELEPPPQAPIEDADLAPLPPPPLVLRSWSEALSLVRAQAPGYASNQANVVRAEAQARIALAGILPTINGKLSYDHEFITDAVPFGTSSITVPPPNVLGATGTFIWPVLAPRAIYAVGTSNRNVDAARLGFSEARRQIAIGLVDVMLGTLAAAQVAELNRVGLGAALERLQMTRTRLEFRQGTELDVDRAQQDVAAARTQLVNGDESARKAREALGVAVGSKVPMTAPGNLDLGDFEKAVAGTCRINADLERRPDIAAARSRLLVAERGENDALLQYAPAVALQSQVTYSSEVTFGPQTTWNVQAVLSVPIFDATRFGLVRDAVGATEQARQALLLARLDALVDFAQSARSVAVAARLRDLAREQRDLARRIDQRTREGYLHGVGTSLDLVTSAQALRQAEINLALLTFQASQARVHAVLAQAECVY
jgi:multidrug efflux system outer membrane protein